MTKSTRFGRRAALAGSAAAIGALAATGGRAQARPINFTAWSAAVDQVKSHISAFEKATGNKVNYENFPWAQYSRDPS